MQLLKEESIARQLDYYISYFLGLYPGYLPEILHFSPWMADYYSSLPIAGYWYHIQKCHVVFSKHSGCGTCYLKLSESEMPEAIL